MNGRGFDRTTPGALVTLAVGGWLLLPAGRAEGQQIIASDLVVQGSTCSGIDCVSGESFGFDTIRLKENNVRLQFFDTSTTAGFANVNWQLRANASASGGGNFFALVDQGTTGTSETGTIVLQVDAGAPADALRLSSTGRLGLRTAAPVLDVHVNTSNTPAFRLEQNNSGGFTAQTWDVASNEANFFVRDVTGGSRLPFRIRPGAPTSSVDINANGRVGIGTAGPLAKLHVQGLDGTTKVLIQEATATVGPREMLELRNNGLPALIFKDTSVPQRWSNGSSGGNFILNEQVNPGFEFVLSDTGNLTIAGMLTQNSDRATKTDLAEVDPTAMLARLDGLPIMSWRKRGEAALHVGPTAQDFSAAFGLGEDDRHIAPLDAAGVCLAAVKALGRQMEAKDARVRQLEEDRAELARRLADLEALVRTASTHRP